MPHTTELTSLTRLLGIDFGTKRIGLAVSDPTGQFAVGLETLLVRKQTDVLAEIATLCQRYEVSEIVLGLPLNMNGSEGPRADVTRDFGDQLADALGLPVLYLDERLTSVLAHQTLRAQGFAPSRHKGWVDEAAAKRLVQDVLDQRNAAANRPEKA